MKLTNSLFTVVLLLSAMFGFSSCSDNETVDYTENLIGTWLCLNEQETDNAFVAIFKADGMMDLKYSLGGAGATWTERNNMLYSFQGSEMVITPAMESSASFNYSAIVEEMTADRIVVVVMMNSLDGSSELGKFTFNRVEQDNEVLYGAWRGKEGDEIFYYNIKSNTDIDNYFQVDDTWYKVPGEKYLKYGPFVAWFELYDGVEQGYVYSGYKMEGDPTKEITLTYRTPGRADVVVTETRIDASQLPAE